MKPLVADYLASMARSLASAGMTVPLQVMQSRGGLMSSAIARQRPARLFLSGATAGVVGGIEAGRAAGFAFAREAYLIPVRMLATMTTITDASV